MQDFDNMPLKESMHKAQKKKKLDYTEFLQFTPTNREKLLEKEYRKIDRKLKRSIGVNYDNVYSWLCNKYKANIDFGYLKSYFLDQFVEFASSIIKKTVALYTLDEKKNITKIE